MRRETLEQLIIRAHKSAVEFKQATRKAQMAFGGEVKVGILSDLLEWQRDRIWQEIVTSPSARIELVGLENSWHMNITIDNLTLERIIYGTNGVKIHMNSDIEKGEEGSK